MKILIIEDELPAAKRLEKMVHRFIEDAEILAKLDSVETAVDWLQTFPKPDLIFMDIQLADGLSFDIFTQTEIQSPIIFTTAYDQYTLKAFKVNSVDYLLKPIDPEELNQALQKFKKHYFNQQVSYDQNLIEQLLHSVTKQDYKERFLVKTGQHLQHISVDNIAYFYSEDGMVYLQTQINKRYVVDYTLDHLARLLDPNSFFRINRKFITNVSSIQKIHTYFNSRLLLELQPKISDEVIVSRDRVGDFKRWLDK